MKVKINSDTYGVESEFDSMDEAQDVIRACGDDFAGTTLSMSGGMIYDQDSNRIGHFMHRCVVSDRLGTMPTRTTLWYDTWGSAHDAAERLARRYYGRSDRHQIHDDEA